MPDAGLEILLVDDHDLLRKHLSCALQSAGHRCIGVCSAQRAIAVLKDSTHSIDALVIDIGLPDTNGVELRKQIASFRPNLPTVFVTGNLANPILMDGAVAHMPRLQKPFELAELLAALLLAATSH